MRSIRYVLWALVVVGLLGLAGLAYHRYMPSEGPQIATLEIGGPFSMTDQDGKSVTQATYAGKPIAIFFGFTFCPDICPTGLARLAGLVNQLGVDGTRLQVIFVTVDPQRDTPAIIKTYLANFNPRFTGLIGTDAQLAAFAKSYRVFYEKIPQSDGNYTMNHSASTLLFSEAGQFAGTIDPHEDEAAALGKLKRLVSH